MVLSSEAVVPSWAIISVMELIQANVLDLENIMSRRRVS